MEDDWNSLPGLCLNQPGLSYVMAKVKTMECRMWDWKQRGKHLVVSPQGQALGFVDIVRIIKLTPRTFKKIKDKHRLSKLQDVTNYKAGRTVFGWLLDNVQPFDGMVQVPYHIVPKDRQDMFTIKLGWLNQAIAEAAESLDFLEKSDVEGMLEDTPRLDEVELRAELHAMVDTAMEEGFMRFCDSISLEMFTKKTEQEWRTIFAAESYYTIRNHVVEQHFELQRQRGINRQAAIKRKHEVQWDQVKEFQPGKGPELDLEVIADYWITRLNSTDRAKLGCFAKAYVDMDQEFLVGTIFAGSDNVMKALRALMSRIGVAHGCNIPVRQVFRCEKDEAKMQFCTDNDTDGCSYLFNDCQEFIRCQNQDWPGPVDLITNAPIPPEKLKVNLLVGGFSCKNLSGENAFQAKFANCLSDTNTETGLTFQGLLACTSLCGAEVVIKQATKQNKLNGQNQQNKQKQNNI